MKYFRSKGEINCGIIVIFAKGDIFLLKLDFELFLMFRNLIMNKIIP